MDQPLPSGAPPAVPLDPRLNELLLELPEALARVVDDLIRERERLVALAELRSERLQRLQEASAALSRSLDRADVEHEFVRHVARMIPCAGVVIARSGAPGAPMSVGLHWRDGAEQDAAAAAHVLEAATAASQTGRAARTPPRRPAGGSAPAPAVLAVPLRAGYKLAGVAAVYGDELAAFGEEEEELLGTLGTTAATALANAALFAESVREKRQSEALAALAASLGLSLRLSDVLRLSLRHAAAILGAEGAVVALRREEYLHIVAAEGTATAVQGIYVPIAESHTGRAMLEGRTLIMNNVTADGVAYERTRALGPVQKVVAAPLLTPDGPIGVLSVGNREADFTEEDGRVAERLAAQLALAVVNARLYEEASDATRELSAAFDAIAGGMAVLDGEGFITRHNARLAAFSGLDAGDALVGRAFFAVLLREPRELDASDPLGTAILRREVGRGTVRQPWTGKVFDIVASPHPAGGAVVTVDDVTSFHALAERHRLVVESTTDAILITARNGVIEFANDAAASLLAPQGGLTGVALAAFLPPDMLKEFDGHVARALSGDAMRFNGAVLRGDGEERRVSMSLAPMRGGGPVTGLVASIRDVSDETRARDEAAAANARYRNLVEVAADAIYTLDGQGIFTAANLATETLLGIQRDALLGRSIVPFLEPPETAGLRAHFTAALGGSAVRYECHVVRVDGTRRLVSVSNTPIRRGGRVTGVLGVARDVTDDRARAAALERAEARYTRLIEAADDAICTADEEGNFTSVNRALEHVMGRSRESLVGTHFTELVHPSERGELWLMFAASLEGRRRRREMRFTRTDGVERIATVITAPIYEHGHVSAVLGIVRDVTEERMLLEQVVRREKLAALGELVGGVAHEVNSPLTGILAFAQILQLDQTADEEARHAAGTIVSEAKRAARIVGKLLTFARQNPPEKMRTELNQVIQDTIELRRYPLKMQQIALVVEFGDNLPATWADPFQLQQVFINLLSNAEQALAAHAGERRVTVRTELRGGSLVASVADTGPGIAPEHLPHIFNPFYTTKPRGIGTGLGLSISFGIVREHGGTLQVASEAGKGAVFELSLPVVTAPSHRGE
ncbi:MAG: PAS domain S-box protein [Gemmatimonadales bacterium]